MSGGYVGANKAHGVPMAVGSKKRPWFQIHLSTAIVLMFVAGGLMWANIGGRKQNVPCHLFFNCGDEVFTSYGWPLVVYRNFHGYSSTRLAHLEVKDYSALDIPYTRAKFAFKYYNAGLDTFICLAICMGMWFICEKRVCRSI